jgi:signal transduction histidine kinase
MIFARLRAHGFQTLVVVLLVAAEIAVVGGSSDGPAAVRYLFPVLWTLPLLLYRRAPEVAVLTVLGSVTVEAFLAQPATESITTLLPVMLAYWIAGTIENEFRSVTVALVGVVLGVVVVAQNPGALGAGDAVFLAIAAGAPYAVGVAMRARDRRERELARRAEALERERDSEARAAVAEERTRIARELHDVVGHSVTVMMVQAGAARMLVDSDPSSARGRLLAVEESGREALDEMRRMLEVLRDTGDGDALGPQPGVEDVEQLVSDARAAGIDVDLAIEGEPVALPPGEALAAYRIVQEALTNVHKHARGTHVDVRVRYVPGALELAVENEPDDLGSPGSDGAGGHGLIGMRERVNLYRGELHVGPRAEGGFAVRARLPIKRHSA